MYGTMKQLMENNLSESALFSLEELMNLEFKSWLAFANMSISGHVFDELIDHNLIYHHDIYKCQEKINSGMLLITLAIMKLFIDDRNGFAIEERRNLG